MKKLLAVICAAAICSAVHSEVTNYNYQEGVKARKLKEIQWYAAMDGKLIGFYQIAAKLRLGEDIERCRRDFATQLDNPTGEMFYSLPMMYCYLSGYQFWTKEIHEKARKVMTFYWPYRGDTENHWVMWYTGLLLAAQTWPDMTAEEWANGRSSKENYEDAKAFLNSWFETTTTIGQGEFDSPSYLMEYMGALIALYDFAKEPVLKQKAEMALDWILADYAIDYLYGAYTGGHSRMYDNQLMYPYQDGGGTLGYIYFGNTPFPNTNSIWFSIGAALSDYQMPEIIYDIANDRSTPFLSFEKKRVRNIIRYGTEKNPPVHKVNYMSRNFSVGSIDGGLQQPIQTHTWGITYVFDNKNKNDEIFSVHPYYSDIELAMFFPERVKIMIGEVVKSKGSYNKEDKWTGGSPYERTFQNKNVIMGLYDLDKNTPFKHVDFYFPKSLSKREVDPSGWVFCQGGDAYIALRPFKPGVWTTDEPTCDRFRSPELRNGYVAEAFESSDFKSWDDFKAKILASTKLDTANLDKDVAAVYTTSAGDLMKFQYPDKKSINGTAVDYSDMKLFDNPYMQGDKGVLDIKYKEQELVIDFNKNEITKKLIIDIFEPIR